MTGEELADQLRLEGEGREAFLVKLRGIQRLWSGLKDAQYPDNKIIKRQLEQYRAALEKALRLAKMLPEHMTEIQPDPNYRDTEPVEVKKGRAPVLSSRSPATPWLRQPPHPIDYLQYALWELAAGDPITKMPRTDTHKRDVLLNNLVDLFAIACPDAEPKLYWNNHKDSYAGGFYSFLSNVLPLVDTNSGLLQTLSQRFVRRSQ